MRLRARRFVASGFRRPVSKRQSCGPIESLNRSNGPRPVRSPCEPCDECIPDDLTWYDLYSYNLSHMTRRLPRLRPRPALSDLEHEVMQAVWASGPCTVETVHQAVARQRDLKEVTTRTVLRRLEHK